MGRRTSALVGVAGVVAGVVIGAAGVSAGAGPSSAAASSDCPVAEYAMGLRYQQQGAEAKALQRQSYALATRNLDEIVGHTPAKKRAHLAIISDLDETALDNTPLLARDLQACHDYTTWDTWTDWELHGDPTLIPGAAEFFAHADKLGVSIYYVSDRYEENKPSTLATLHDLGLPQASADHVLLLGPSKAVRRASVAADHQLVMQLGDSLPDFDGAFKGVDLATQQQLVVQNAGHFGRDWIVFPNAAYGKWSTATLAAWDRPLTMP